MHRLLRMASEGSTDAEIALALGLPEDIVRAVTRSPLAQALRSLQSSQRRVDSQTGLPRGVGDSEHGDTGQAEAAR